jgi:hypothetical protein
MYLTPDEFQMLENLIYAPRPLILDSSCGPLAETLQELGLARRTHETWRATAYGIARWRAKDGLQH